LLRGVRTATTALCKGPLIPPMIMSKNLELYRHN